MWPEIKLVRIGEVAIISPFLSYHVASAEYTCLCFGLHNASFGILAPITDKMC